MFSISKEIQIDMAHRVPYTDSPCRHLHGHRWKIVAHVAAEALVSAVVGVVNSGMVVDYSVIKQALMEEVHDRFDHRLVLWESDGLLVDENERFMEALRVYGLANGVVEVPMIPTSEGLARWWGQAVAEWLNESGVTLTKLEVWETPTSVATYYVPGISERV